MARCIQPDYVKDFKCDGKFCGCRCCRDWQIVLDDDAYNKFSELSEVDREEILRHVDWKRDLDVDVEVMTLKLDDNGLCSFLTADGLCSIQKKHGEDFLTAICQSYPRVTYKLGEEIFEQSMTLTCPVAAQMILLSDDPINFVEVEEVKTRAIIGVKIGRNVEDFIKLQMDAIKILQDRNFTINQRLKKFYERLGGKISSDIAFNLQSHTSTLVEIFTKVYGANLNERKKNELTKSYASFREFILREVHKNFSEVLENYLVNEFFMRCYPGAFSGGDKRNGKIFITSYKLLEFAIVLTVIAKNKFNAYDLAELIISVNDMLDRSHGGMDALIEFAKSCDDEIFAQFMLDN